MDYEGMVGSVSSLAQVPLREVLPRDYVGAEAELQKLASELDSHLAAAGRTAWHWYPDRTEPPPSPETGLYVLLVDAAITLYNTGVDWLELALDVAWVAPPRLTVNAAVEVACWCPQDHNIHRVRTGQWHAANSRELVAAFAAGTAMLIDSLTTGPFDPHPWRVQADLPDAPESSQ
jgi:hypothetical protein